MSKAIVMVGGIPHGIFPGRKAAAEYVDQLPEERTESVWVAWPVSEWDSNW